MNDMVKNSIECRKTALFNGYEITDDVLINKIEDLFARINQFGESCSDSTDFEARFAQSELNQEYIQIFTEVVTKCKSKNTASETTEEVKDDDNGVLNEVADDIRFEAKEATLPFRRKVRQEVTDTARDMPVIGDIMYAKQNYDFFSRFRKKKDKNKDIEKEDKK